MTVTIERRASYVVLTLHQTEQQNALSAALIEELQEAFQRIEGDSEVRCAILTGTGDQPFYFDTRINRDAPFAEPETRNRSEQRQALANQIAGSSVPVIAAINGPAAGGGFELVLACHIRIASPNASFRLTETMPGTLPGNDLTQRLAQEMGSGRGLQMGLTGTTVDAEEALRIGLINRIAAPRDLLSDAESLAGEISKMAPLAIRACLQAVTRGLELPLAEGLALEAQLFSSLFATDDMREGTRAFLEKRPPVFKGS